MNIIEEAVKKANREIPEAVSCELYNAALEALDDDEAHKSYDPNPRLPERLREALRAWTDMEYRKHLGRL
jgi:hypothetical protein